MGTSGSAPDVTREDIRSVFSQFDEPSTPITASEVAEVLECPTRTAQHNLEKLAELDEIKTRQIDGSAQVWWQPGDRESPAQQSESTEFDAFVNAVADYAIFMLDPDGTIVSWNTGAERIKGYTEDEIIGEHFCTFYTGDDIDEDVPDQNLETAAIEGRVEDEGWRVRKDGSRFWAKVTITAVRSDDGSLQGFTKVTHDMTERREYEQQLRQERDLIEQIFETVPVSIGVLDSDGQFVRANPRMLERHGIDEADLAEYSLTSLDIQDVDGNPLPREEWPLLRALETGAPVYDFQCQATPPNGDCRWLSINAAPLEDDSQDADRVVVAVDDITGQKEREQQLRRERDQTEQLLRTAPIAIAVQDADGETILANQRAQEALGLSEQEIIEEPEESDEWELYDANGDPIRPGEMPSARVLATGKPVVDQEIHIEPPTGDRMRFHLNAAPIVDSEGAVERVITTGEDITELKKREQQLEQRKTELETELSEVFGRISDAFYALDDEWRFTHLNDQAAELMQRSTDELLDRVIWDAFPHASEVYRDHFETAMETQEPVTFELYADRLGAWLEFNIYPSESGLSIYFRDITERKEREQTLAKYETIVETVEDGIYVKDDNGQFTMVNEAYTELTGYDREELVGSHASLVVDETTIERAKETKETKVPADETKQTVEAMIKTADGNSIPTEGSFATIEARNGESEQVGVVRDISNRKEYERKIEESERRYRTLIENFPNGSVGLFNEELEYTAIGGQLLDTLDLEPEDRIGRNIHELHSDGFAEEIESYFQAALMGESNTFEAEFQGRHLQAHTLPVKNADDEIFAGMVVVQDISERREVQQELRESEAKFRMLAENLEEIVWMATEDADEFIYVNPAFETVWGTERDTLYDEPLSFLDAVHEEDRERVQKAFTMLPEGEFDEEFRIIRPEGEVRWVHARGARVEDEDGEMVRIVGIGEDITERVERERELERVLDLLEKTERIADVGGWEINTETKDVFWTDHIFELLEVDTDEEPPLEDALGMYHEADQPIVEDAIENALGSGDSFDVETRVRTDNGEIRWLRLQGVPEANDDDVVSLRGAAQDITERKQREQRLEELVGRLEESNERLEQFAYAASHDLQEPLRMVSSYLQLIERRYADELDEDGKEFIEFAVDGADRMRSMIEGLLEYSRVETQGDPFEQTDLETVFSDVCDNLQLQIEESDAEISADSLPRVEGDADQLRQVFQNLLDNAIEYSGNEPPRIDITAERNRDKWVISVSDDGIGIDPADADRIFEVFQRLHNQDEHAGTGIGLALCQRIIERHGGDIWVESESGDGSTFSFTLPTVTDHDT